MVIFLTLLAAVIGGLIGLRLKIPAGAMVGSLFAVGLMNLIRPIAYLPMETKVLTQSVAGMFIGVSFRRADLPAMKKLIVPVVVSVTAVMGMGFAMGFLLMAMTGFDAVTSLFSCMPGGVVDMSLMADDLGGETAVVSVLQMIRLVTVVSLFPQIIRRVASKVEKKNGAEGEAASPKNAENGAVPAERPKRIYRPREVGITFCVALAFGICGKLIGIPAGPILCSMLAVAGQNILFDNAAMPIEVKRVAQMLAGALIGEGITLEKLIRLKVIILPALILVALYVLFNIVAGLILYKTTDIDAMTAFFSLAPGGASDVTLIAGDYGCHMPTISAFHMLRAVVVVGVSPVIISLLAGL